MEKYVGKAASSGVAIGKIIEIKKDDHQVRRIHIGDIDKEKSRFANALEIATKELEDLYEKAITKVGEANAAIFEVHKMMLEDMDYIDSINNIIETSEVNAEYAIATTSDNFSSIFANMDDDYMKERAADIKDISNRLISILGGNSDKKDLFTEPGIIVADDLAPSETVTLDKEKVLGFVTRKGSTNSHTAILSRTMNIPAVVSVDIPYDIDGKTMIVNGVSGEIFLEPTDEIIDEQKKLIEKEEENRKLLEEYKGKKAVTKDGKEIMVFANIGGLSDIGAVLQNDGNGIGLFRSEFLYLQEEDFPTEEAQFLIYKQVAEIMGSKKVIIRTLDIGADKQIGYFNLDKEENPAMGLRAIRICLTREEIFRTQLRALLRASVFGNISIMIPMITSVWEVKKVKEILEEVKVELSKEEIAYKDVEFGIMIETPAAVMVADELANEVDFFSIGSNDLTQYTLAIDRQNPKLDMFYDTHHPAILKMIKMVVDAAHSHDIWAGICGELGADLELTKEFIEMGVDELSVVPNMILKVKREVINS
ncbi:MAG: phosphoenolpyruvate--protein phosphotransferase [Lachnospiraceae bacterium]|jgi:phosphotransferase system enzyme I (PtsI)|nr:phosphoenolpyruvate--protein phosphotransferase [Lachnospiraceae bacterium]